MWVFSGSITGYFSYSLDSSEPRCLFISADGDSSEIEDIDLCCSEIQNLLVCEETDDSFDYICYNLKEGNNYYINSKTYNYCLKESYV